MESKSTPVTPKSPLDALSITSDILTQRGAYGRHRRDRFRKAYAIITDDNIPVDTFDSQKKYNILAYLIINDFPLLTRHFLQKNPNVTLKDGEHGSIPLHCAAVVGNCVVVRDLLKYDPEVDARDNYGETPLMKAVRHHNLDVIKLLVEAKADSTIRSNAGATALSLAEECLGNTKNKRGKTALDLANEKRYGEIVTFLKSLSTVPEEKERKTEAAPPEEHEKMGQELIAFVRDGADEFFNTLEKAHKVSENKVAIQKAVNYVDNRNKTALDYAVEEGNRDAINRLVALGADVYRKDLKGNTVFHRVAREGDVTALRRLCYALKKADKGIDLEVKDNDGNTPLLIASKNSKVDCVIALIAYGAKSDTPNKKGETPNGASKVVKDFKSEDFEKAEKQARIKKLVGLFGHATQLYGASRLEQIQEAQELLDWGVDLEEDSGDHIFAHLILNNHVSLIQKMLKEYPKYVNRPGVGLHYAAGAGNPEVVRMLLKVSKASGQLTSALSAEFVVGDDGDTPLICAVKRRNFYAARVLIAAGADINRRNKKGVSAKDVAASWNLTDILRFMDDFEAAGQKTGTSPGDKKGELTSAQRLLVLDPFSDDLPEVKDQKQQPEAIKQQIKERRSQALMNAIKDGNKKEASRLLSQEFDANYRDVEGCSLLQCAAVMGDAELVERLVKDHKVDIHSTSASGVTALHLAAREDHSSVIKILLAAGARVTNANGQGETPLAVAKKNESHRAIGLLEKAEKDKAEKEINSRALINVMKELARLLSQELDVNYRDTEGYSLLDHAVILGDAELVERLVKDHKVDVHSSSAAGETALHFAARRGHISVIKTLLAAGARPTDTNNKGQTPLDVATESDSLMAAGLLREAQARALPKQEEGLYARMFGPKTTPSVVTTKNTEKTAGKGAVQKPPNG